MACAGSDLTCTGLTTPARARCASSSYWPRPRLRSHPPTSMAALHLALQDNQTDPAMCPAVRLSRGGVWDTKVSVLAQPSKRRSTVDCLAALGSSGLWTFVWRGLTSGRRWGHGRPPNADRNSNGSQSRLSVQPPGWEPKNWSSETHFRARRQRPVVAASGQILGPFCVSLGA